MADLARVVRRVVALADRVTASLQVSVTHEAYAGQDAFRKPSYGTATIRKAIVETTTRKVMASDGHERVATASVTFPRDVAVDVRDRLTLPSGSRAPILKVERVEDPGGGGYVTRVWVG